MSEFDDSFDMEGLDEYSETDYETDVETESMIDSLPEIPEVSEEEFEEGPVRVKTYDGWGTGMSTEADAHDYEGDKNLEGIYENVMEGISESEELSTDEKINQLERLKEEWLKEFE